MGIISEQLSDKVFHDFRLAHASHPSRNSNSCSGGRSQAPAAVGRYFRTHQHRQPLGRQSLESILIGQVVSEVRESGPLGRSAYNPPHRVALVPPWRAQLQPAIERLQLQPAPASRRFPCRANLAFQPARLGCFQAPQVQRPPMQAWSLAASPSPGPRPSAAPRPSPAARARAACARITRPSARRCSQPCDPHISGNGSNPSKGMRSPAGRPPHDHQPRATGPLEGFQPFPHSGVRNGPIALDAKRGQRAVVVEHQDPLGRGGERVARIP